MTEIKRSTKYVRDSSGRVILQRGNAPQPKRTAPPSRKIEPQTHHANVSNNSKPNKFKKSTLTIKKLWLSKRKSFKKIFLVLTLIALSTGAVFIYVKYKPKSTAINKPPAEEQTSIIENLEYQTVLPGGKSIAELGGWKRVSPENSEPVYAYSDSINGIEISVSQQPLPSSFIGDTSRAVAKLAKEYNAVNTLTSGDTKIYIGNSSKGPQSTIFSKNNILILIKSSKKVEDKDWIAYIEALN